MGVYIIRNTQNGKVYIGGTIDIARRWEQHRTTLKRGCNSSAPMQLDYNNGAKLEYHILQRVYDKTKLIDTEQEWIDIYKPYLPENGYNMNPCAKDWTGRKHRQEIIEKIKESKSDISLETRQKISKSCMGRPSSFKGKHHTAANKEIMRQHKIGKPLNAEHRKQLSLAISNSARGKYTDEMLLNAVNLSFSGIKNSEVIKILGIGASYYHSILCGKRKYFFYEEYILPRLNNGERFATY